MPCTEELEEGPPTLTSSSKSEQKDESSNSRPAYHYSAHITSRQHSHSSLKSQHMYINSQINGQRQQEWGDKASNPMRAESEYHGFEGPMERPGPSGDANGNSLSEPCVVLYPPHLLKLQWGHVARKIGVGLVNMGSSCYMNAVLQCLTHTPPLANYCISGEHSRTCTQKNFCLMCQFSGHSKNALQICGSAFKPDWVNVNAQDNVLAKKFSRYRQEDAHEFLRFMVDELQKACLNGYTKLDELSRETTVVNQIFGGYLQSQVRCLRCSARSNTYDPYMDICLDLKDVRTVEEAFAKFVKPETLDTDNAYTCGKCRQKVNAQKRLSIHKHSNVLTIQLKRFDYITSTAKIRKHVAFNDGLNIRPYMSQNQGEPVWYSLYGVLVHIGNDPSCGHYYCHVKSPSNIWYKMNDHTVHSELAQSVFHDEAYVLFYLLDTRTKNLKYRIPNKIPFNGPSNKGWENVRFNGAGNRHGKSAPVSSPVNGHGVSGKYRVLNNSSVNGAAANHRTAQQSPVNGQHNGGVVRNGSDYGASGSQGVSPHGPQSAASGSAAPTALPELRKKISFDFHQKPFQPGHSQAPQSPQKNGPANGSPPKRIVMQIRNGFMTTLEKSADGKEMQELQKKPVEPSTLVPYDYDSDSGGEGTSRHDRGESRGKSADMDRNVHHQEELKSGDQCSSSSWSNQPNPSNFATKACHGESVDNGEKRVAGEDQSHNVRSYSDRIPELKETCSEEQQAQGEPEPASSHANARSADRSPSVPRFASSENNHDFHRFRSELCDRTGETNQFSNRGQFGSAVRRDMRARSGSLGKLSENLKPLKRSSSLDALQRCSDSFASNRDDSHTNDSSVHRTFDAADISGDAVASRLQSSPQHDSEVTNDNRFAQATPVHQTDYQDSQRAPKITLNLSSSGEKQRKKKKKKKKNRKHRQRYSENGGMAEDGYHHHYRKKRHRHDYDYDYSDSVHKDSWKRQTDSSEYDYRGKRYCDSRYSESDYGCSIAKRRKSESSESSEYVWEERTKESIYREKSTLQDQAHEKSVRHYGKDGDWNHASAKSEGGDRYSNGPTWNHNGNRDWRKHQEPWRRAEEPAWTPNQHYQNHNGPSRDRWREDYEAPPQPSYPSQSYNGCSVPSLSRPHTDQNSFHSRTGAGGGGGSSYSYYRGHHHNNNFNGNHYFGSHRSYGYQRRY